MLARAVKPPTATPNPIARTVKTSTATQPGPTRSKSGFSFRNGSVTVPRTINRASPYATPPRRPAGRNRRTRRNRAPQSAPPKTPVNRMRPRVPSKVTRPTISSASVIRPCASSPADTASSRMASHPPAPTTVTPAATPAPMEIAQYQTQRLPTSVAVSSVSRSGGENGRELHAGSEPGEQEKSADQHDPHCRPPVCRPSLDHGVNAINASGSRDLNSIA